MLILSGGTPALLGDPGGLPGGAGIAHSAVQGLSAVEPGVSLRGRAVFQASDMAVPPCPLSVKFFAIFYSSEMFTSVFVICGEARVSWKQLDRPGFKF